MGGTQGEREREREKREREKREREKRERERERGREGALGGDSHEAGPAPPPSSDGRRPQQARDSSGPMACKKAQKLHNLAAKPAADLNPDDN